MMNALLILLVLWKLGETVESAFVERMIVRLDSQHALILPVHARFMKMKKISEFTWMNLKHVPMLHISTHIHAQRLKQKE